MLEYSVSRTVAKYAINLLKRDGLVEGRQGSGVYVIKVHRVVRESPGPHRRSPAGPASPLTRDAAQTGQAAREHRSEHATASPEVARRLAIEPGDPVMLTRYRLFADDSPVEQAVSWEPLALTGGTPVEWPEDGAAVGVVPRMDAIGVHIDECVERLVARAARPDEIEALALPLRGSHVLAVERTYYAAGRPVETADVVLPSDRFEMVYRFPIDS
jgi:GntR family transcriptional regulator